MKILGWLSLVFMTLGIIANISDNNMKPSVRVFAVLMGIATDYYLLSTLI
jgi:hypothetical protein